MATDFYFTHYRLEWWIPLHINMSPDSDQHLIAAGAPYRASEFNKRYFQSADLIFPSFYRCDSALREEIKAAVRRRSHVKGNSAAPFFLWKDDCVTFEILIAHFAPHDIVLLLRSALVTADADVRDAILLSTLPKTEDSQLRYAVEKVAAYLSTGDVRARAAVKSKYRVFPVITVYDYKPRDQERSIRDDVPWHHLASIGTRHEGIRPDNRQLLPRYRDKDLSFRDSVCVIDKQSLMLVTDRDQLEHHSIKFATLVAVHLHDLLRRWIDSSNIESVVGPFLVQLRFSHDTPAAFAEGMTFQDAWVHALDALQILDLMQILERTPKDRFASPGKPHQVLGTINLLQKEAGTMSQDGKKHTGHREPSQEEMPSDTASAGRVFLCHASEDKDVVYEVYRKLKNVGHSPWLDKEDLLPGQEWAKEILKALHSSACVLVFLSSRSVGKRGFVQKEFKLTLDILDAFPEGQIFPIPVLIDDCVVPDSFKRFHWIRLDEPGGFERVLKSIKRAQQAYQNNQ